MNNLFREAQKKAGEVRRGLKVDKYSAVNIYDICERYGIPVRFLSASTMEGLFFVREDGENPQIFISSLRPFPRRCFTCAHEFGHYLFGHGAKMDGVDEYADETTKFDPDEYLVDCFAGTLLAPPAGLTAEFAARNWSIENATPFQMYLISSIFGVGYQTVITQCHANNLISTGKRDLLNKVTPAKILASLLPEESRRSFFKIFDWATEVTVIDLELTNYLFVPRALHIVGDHLQIVFHTDDHCCYEAVRPGIMEITDISSGKSSLVRIQKNNYEGLAQFRHLESKD